MANKKRIKNHHRGHARPLVRLATAYADVDEFPTAARWAGVIGTENELTGDGRLVEGGALRWAADLAENPLPLRFVASDVGAHDGAVVIGGIDKLTRMENGEIMGEGPLYLDTEDHRNAFRAIKKKQQNGISMDLDDISFEVRVAKDLLEAQDDVMLIASGKKDEGDSDGGEQTGEVDRDYEKMFGMESDDEIFVTLDGRVRAATVVAVPAFANARIEVTEETFGEVDTDEADEAASTGDDALEASGESVEALVAAGSLDTPPGAWFQDPGLTGPTSIVVDDSGRIYGHLAAWDSCHVANPHGEGICTSPPSSASGYARFHQGSLKTEEGDIISVGKIVMGAPHAGLRMNAAQATRHYDHTGFAVADVRVGEDEHGIYVAGALRENLSPKQLRELRASPLSGDWRMVDGNLELHAALAVNVPGFPIPRPKGLVASADEGLTALVASGVVIDDHLTEQATPTAGDLELTPEDMKALRGLLDEAHRKERVEAKAAVDAFAAKTKVEAFASSRK